MPKINYNPEEWAIKKQCAYCGKDFYPKVINEPYCGYVCEDAYKAYYEDMDWFYMEEWLKSE